MKTYRETVSICPICGRDSVSAYEEKITGMWLNIFCKEHGFLHCQVERDIAFFKQAYEDVYNGNHDHLVLPVTYNCNLKCKYCYSLSNSSLPLPTDRTVSKLVNIIADFNGPTTLIGGEPTVRQDLTEIIKSAKSDNGKRKISLGTNGQKLSDFDYVRDLKESGLDFVFLSLNDLEYEVSKTVRDNKLEALRNCQKLGLPVWIHQTIDQVDQLDSIVEIMETFSRTIFKGTIRTAKPFGLVWPKNSVFISDILKYLKKQDDYSKGWTPFNRTIRLFNRTVTVCSWVNDMKRLDPVDSAYLISNDTLSTFHRGMKLDELLLKGIGLPPKNSLSKAI